MRDEHTFPKGERLQYGYEFRRVYTQGRKWESPLVAVYVWEPPEQVPRQVGIVTGRRVGNAVARNRGRRLLREAYRLHKHELKDHVHLVLVARGAIRGKGLRDVESVLVALWRKAGLLMASS